MKKILPALMILLMASSAFALDNPWENKLPFKSATIDYKVSGSMKGEKTVYVKDYGRTIAEYSETSMTVMGMTQKLKEVNITTPDWVYTIDQVEGTGTKQVNPNKYFIEEYNKLSKSKKKKVAANSEKMGLSTVEGMSGDFKKNAETILGYKCDRISVMGVESYTISGTGLALKTEGNTMGVKMDEVATKISKGNPPSSKFELPKNIKFEHNKQADQMMQNQAKSVIQSLLDGKKPVAASSSPGNPQGGFMGAGQDGQNQLSPEQLKQMQEMMQKLGGQGD